MRPCGGSLGRKRRSWPRPPPPCPPLLCPCRAEADRASTEVGIARPHCIGGVASPEELLPQQATVLSVLIAQANSVPALIEVNMPDGGVARPYVLSPQQAMVPSVRIAQAY